MALPEREFLVRRVQCIYTHTHTHMIHTYTYIQRRYVNIDIYRNMDIRMSFKEG